MDQEKAEESRPADVIAESKAAQTHRLFEKNLTHSTIHAT